jgi:hypothetical protein
MPRADVVIGIRPAGKHEILPPAKGGLGLTKVPLFHGTESRTFGGTGFGFEG